MLPYHEAYFIGGTWDLSEPQNWEWQGQDRLVCLTAHHHWRQPSDRCPRIGTEAQGQGGDQCHQSHFRGPHQAYCCLIAFEIRGQDWVVDARKLLDALQDFSVVSHLEPKETWQSYHEGQAESSGTQNRFITRSLFSRPLENESFCRAESPQGFYYLCDCWWARRLLGVGSNPNSSIWLILSASQSSDCSNNTTSHYWEHTPSRALGSAPLLSLSWNRIFLPTDCLWEAGRIDRPDLESLDFQGQKSPSTCRVDGLSKVTKQFRGRVQRESEPPASQVTDLWEPEIRKPMFLTSTSSSGATANLSIPLIWKPLTEGGGSPEEPTWETQSWWLL